MLQCLSRKAEHFWCWCELWITSNFIAKRRQRKAPLRGARVRYRARRPAAHRSVAVGRVDVGIGQNAARLTAIFGRNYRLNNMYFTPSERPVTPSNSPVMWGYATTLGVHMPMVHLADSSQTKIAAQKQPKIAYFTPPGQNFPRLRRAYKALRVGGSAGPGHSS